MKRYRRALALIFMMFVLAACGSAESPSAAAPTAPAPSLGAPPVAAVAATDTPSIPSPQPAPTSSDAPAPAQTVAVIVPTSVVATNGPIISKQVTAIVRSATVGPAVTAGPVMTPTALHGPVTITSGDNLQTLHLAVGETFVLKLGAPMDWHVRVGDQRIVAPIPNAALPAGAQGVYRALAAGQTELLADGAAPCRKAHPPCMIRDMLFRLTIVVQ